MDDTVNISFYLKALARRTWMILIIFVVGSLFVAAVAYVLPPVYASTARILVESQQIPEDLAQTTVRQSVVERLELIKQRLMTRNNLLGVIDRMGLFADRDDLTPTDKVDRVRDATTFESVSFSDDSRYRGRNDVAAFTITYHANSAPQAARVANEFVTMVLEQNLASRSKRATETSEFFRQEVKRLSRELLDLETQIAAYKDKNEAALPDSYEFRLNQVAALQQRQFESEKRRIELEEQRSTLENPQQDDVKPDKSLSPDERELARLRQALVRKSSMFAPTHPEIVALKASISALESTIAANAANGGSEAGSADGTTPDGKSTSGQTEAQLALVKRELALIAEQRTATAKQISDLQASLAETPKVQLALNAYERRHRNLQTQYQNAVLKLAEAETGQRLEVNRQAERFEVIEQPQVPTEPIAPQRYAIATAGSGASLMLGLVLALVIEMSTPTIRTGSDLQRRLQLRPVVTVPYIHTRGERSRLVFKWLIRIALLVVGVTVVLWAVDQYVIPLAVLWSRFVEASGLEDVIRAIQARLA